MMRTGTARRLMAMTLAAVSILGGVVPAAADAPNEPALELIAAADRVDLYRWGKGPVWLDLGLYMAVTEAPFHVLASRETYEGPFSVRQVLADGSIRHLPGGTVRQLRKGFRRFFTLTIKRTSGKLVAEHTRPFCPNAWEQVRISPDASDSNRFPSDCGWSDLALGSAWGIDQGWASSISLGDERLRPGKYIFKVVVNERYRDLFGMSADPIRVRGTVIDDQVTWIDRGGAPSSGGEEPEGGEPGSSSVGEIPGPEARPDLVAGPAHRLEIFNEDGRDYLSFAATVWNKGPATLVVDGFRRRGEALMDAYQSFYVDGVKVGSVDAGSLIYDPRPGHEHWHFQDFAMYRLWDAGMTSAVVSDKEAFCLAPTDAIDLTVPGAVYRPEFLGLGSACGGKGALSIREVLQTGWGDTYMQWLPGQSFDITTLPNGTYYVEVEANADGRLYEVTDENNRTLREVTLGGVPGARTVTATPYLGLKI